jgi:endoglucanase
MTKKIFGSFLLLVAVVIVSTVAYRNSNKHQIPIVFSPTSMLRSLWQDYKTQYVEASTGRTVDHQRNLVTTSEGQSYTLLRAVWVDDKAAFDQSWQWTKEVLQHKDDQLFSWLFGQRDDGSYGILFEQGGQNSAADGDTDIALALIFASERWQDNRYLEEARAIINDIWEHEVVTINNKPYVTANNLEKYGTTSSVLINPSYFAPYAYRIFARIDTSHDWPALVDTSYEVINTAVVSPLDKSSSAHLPPDWILLDRTTAAVLPPTKLELTTNYSYDAMRLPWRLALDWQWFGETRAQATLAKLDFLGHEWQTNKALYSNYSHDGIVVQTHEAPSLYGGAIGYFMVTDHEHLKDVYEQKLKVLYNPDTFSWKQPLSYYDDNWAWFGIALYHKALINLAPPLVASKSGDPANH